MIMERKRKIIAELAQCLVENKLKISGKLLSDILNFNDIETNYGTQYEGGRGIYTLIHAVYNYYYEHDPSLAEQIALAFTNECGEYVYE